VVLLPLAPWLDAAALRGLADATTDLAAPLRGPFDREKRAPSAAETAAVQLAKLARLLPSAIVAPGPPAQDQIVVAAEAISAYEREAALALAPVAAARVPLEGAENARLHAFRPADGGVEHLAIVIGEPDRHSPALVRLHSECFTGDLLASLKCDCGEQLRGAVRRIAAEGAGVLLYLAQEGRGIGLMNKLRAYRLQEQGFDTVEANLRLGFDADERVFLPAAQMLRLLGFSRVRLLTNNPDKVAGLAACGVEVVERVAHSFPSNTHNELYLATKKAKSGHLL
jgi:GTP cyclohydrolase II